jgi:hypothetical protein
MHFDVEMKAGNLDSRSNNIVIVIWWSTIESKKRKIYWNRYKDYMQETMT